MDNVTFDEDKDLDVRKNVEVPKPSGLIGALIAHGLAADAKTANLLAGGVAVLLFLLAGFIVYTSFSTEEKIIPNVKNIPFNQV